MNWLNLFFRFHHSPSHAPVEVESGRMHLAEIEHCTAADELVATLRSAIDKSTLVMDDVPKTKNEEH